MISGTAGSSTGEWNGADTASFTARKRPVVLRDATTASMTCWWPEMTVCVALFKLAATATPGWLESLQSADALKAAARTAAGVVGSNADMPVGESDTWFAFAIALPLVERNEAACIGDRQPAADRAEISPTL